jgi:hypothetical protein
MDPILTLKNIVMMMMMMMMKMIHGAVCNEYGSVRWTIVLHERSNYMKLIGNVIDSTA